MIITNVTGAYFLKQNDTATKMRLFISEADGITPVDLASAIRLEVVIGVPDGRVLVKTPTILEEPGQLEFGLDDGDLLPTGDDRLEVHVFYAANMKRVAPSKGFYKLRIQEPIDELNAEVTTFTLDYFLAEVNRMTGNIPAIAEQANTLIEELNIALPLVTQASIEAEQAAQTALTASNNAAAANVTFDAIIPLAQNATTAATQATTVANNAATSASNAALSANNAAGAANAAASLATNAGNAAQLAADIANGTISSLEDLQDDLAGYNIPIIDFTLGTAFLKGQTARFNGSTYRAKVVTQGNPLPTMPALENEWWTLVAQRGVDGAGSVSSVNGIQPNQAGDVILPLPEPTWGSVLNKPSTFQPSAHTHSIPEITNLQNTIDQINASITSIGQTIGPDGSIDASVLLDGSVTTAKLAQSLQDTITGLVDTSNASVIAEQNLATGISQLDTRLTGRLNQKIDKASGYSTSNDANTVTGTKIEAINADGLNSPPGTFDGWTTIATFAPFEEQDRAFQLAQKWNDEKERYWIRKASSSSIWSSWKQLVHLFETDNWLPAALLNGWVNYDNDGNYTSAAYRLDELNNVHLKGIIKDGNVYTGTILFRLPLEMRPMQTLVIPTCTSLNGVQRITFIEIHKNGDVKIGSDADRTWLALDNIVFKVQN